MEEKASEQATKTRRVKDGEAGKADGREGGGMGRTKTAICT